jgi:uncharacterized membrane protein YdjX (TVP38/TMEM64 family)
VCAIGAVGVATLVFPIHPRVADLAEWARGAGAPGVLAFVLAQVACALLVVPAWPLRVGAGFVYGPILGLAVALPASLAGALLAFAAGRLVFRERIARWIEADRRLGALDDAIGARGRWVVLLLRLSPLVPNEVVNYGLGATRVRWQDYALASFAGMLPLTAMYTWIGSLLTTVADLGKGRSVVTGQLGQILWWGGLATTIAVVAICKRAATAELARRVGRAGDPRGPRPEARLAIDG